MSIDKFVGMNFRIYADFDNERRFDWNVVLLSKTDEVVKFDGEKVSINEGDYVYLFMEIGDGDYAVSEGVIIKNPYASIPVCKWCCRLMRDVEYMSEYERKFI